MLLGAFFLLDHGQHSEVHYVAVQWGPRGDFQLSAWKLTAKSSQICAFPLCGHQMRQKIQPPISPNALQGWARRLHKQRCAGRAAGGDSSHCFPSPPLTSTEIQHCGFVWVPSGSPVLGQVYCFWAFNMPQVFTARIPTAFCARAFYGKLQRSPLSPTQTFRLLWI